MKSWLEKRAALSPDQIGLYAGNKNTWTFREMNEEATELAELIAPYIQSREPVALLITNQPQSVFLIHALQKIRVPVLMLNNRLSTKEWAYQLKDSRAQLVIFEDQFAIEADRAVSIDVLRSSKQKNIEVFEQEDVCSIMYTSGTTGNPKGVMQTYDNHFASATGSAFNIGHQPDDIWMCAVPLFHISGYSILMRSVIYGIAVRLYEKFDERRIHADLVNGNGSVISVVTTMLQRLLDVKNERYHPFFRCMILGGGPAPLHMVERCHDEQIPVFQSYGMTETASQFTTLSPADARRKTGASGKPLFPGEIKIVDEEGKNCAENVIGEIFVKGPSVTKGYLNNQQATASAFDHGWLKTGDVGYLDDEGFLFVADRRSDLIISGGENIYPAEIESVISSHPAVKEAGVVGKKDEQWGEVPVAYVVLLEELDQEVLHSYITERLARYKHPKLYRFTNELPRNAAGKLVRRKLKEEINHESV
ncbi:O-succinylbenzoic acid--CoA ligase [Jeotgalibacillus malaysiensis]|uniref:2-succinylbenzoate--CoA ligase n=1 Tax=Jeotgalibacillus malaysiensis TaxID=1508404 RepID=A0A0B5ANP4_9BACL|nr:o-succinylbenzoate--CoA ligase [Jeotgalibacillus malaysiensis]AJD91865.1 O-succinylbenzoic acid--CoA ligase [Jeotgalibacillus malaysiensis]